MVSCAVCGRSQTKNTKTKGISFHHFPKNIEQRNSWILFANKPDWTPSKNAFLCSLHFADDCFDRSSLSKIRLKDCALPTITVTRTKYVRSFCNEVISPSTSQVSQVPLPTVPLHLDTSRSTTPLPVQTTTTSLELKPDDTPRKVFLKRKLSDMHKTDILKSKKIRYLQKKNWAQKKTINTLSAVILELKNKSLLMDEYGDTLLQKFGNNNDLIRRLFKKSTNQKVSKTYSQAERSFAVTLHFFSPKGYNFVRQKFENCLPHPKTLPKWYSTIDAKPGFTSEAFEVLKLKVQHENNNVICSLVFDEMAIRQHVEYDGTNYHGYVDFGNGIQHEYMDVAKEALVFMVVAINGSWKLPVGYFFIKGISSEQKKLLVTDCLANLEDCGVTVTNITFDGCPVNLSMCKALGCVLESENFKTKFYVDNSFTYIFPDPSHMIKLVRNTWGGKMYLMDADNNIIDYNFVKKLNLLQENEGLHLCNKLRRQHINFFKQKMKVKLATQLLSRSVAEALLFCKNNLKLKEFENCEATANFILLMNDAFDILNSRKLSQYDFKRACCEQNFHKIEHFAEKFKYYVLNLKTQDGIYILNSQRKIGFLGLLLDFESLIGIYNDFIKNNKLQFLPLYKCSQDHLELFFGSVRSQGGYNNNPTCRQFISAYKKILIHAEIREGGVGNCILLDQINILNVNHTSKAPEDIINEENIIYSEIDTEEQCVSNFNLDDHDYALNVPALSDFTKEITIYVAGFVVYKIKQKIKCEHCVNALFGVKENLLNSFLDFKNRGGLCYPHDDVITLCVQIEKVIRREQLTNNKVCRNQVSIKVLKWLMNNSLFDFMTIHDNSPLQNHKLLLIKCIINCHVTTRIHFICKNYKPEDKIRNYYNKIILFKGQ